MPVASTVFDPSTSAEALLAKIDGYIEANVEGPVPPPTSVEPVRSPNPPMEINLAAADITCVIWATGYERKYPWLDLPILDERGEIRHERGVTPEPGVVVIGMRFQATKGSNLIDGVGADAKELADYLANREDVRPAA